MLALGLTWSERLSFLALLAVVAVLALRTCYRRYALVRSGRSADLPAETLAGRLRRFLLLVPGQWSNLRTVSWRDPGGAQHLVLFWSALWLAGYYLVFLVLGEAAGLFGRLPELPLARAYLQVAEILGLLLLVALVWGVVRRAWLQPARLGPDFEVGLFLKITAGALLLLGCFFLLAGLRLNLGLSTHPGPISGWLAPLLQLLPGGAGGQNLLFHLCWWVQAGLLACFLFYIPYSDHQHALFAPFNILASVAQPRGRLAKLAMDRSYRGVNDVAGFTWKQLLELYGCAQCGRCQDACPAHAAGKALSPKKIIQDLRVWMDDQGRIRPFWKGARQEVASPDAADRVTDAELWACTTCMACAQACPALVSALDKVVDLRRDRVLTKSACYPEVVNLFRDLENHGDIFGKGRATREDWAVGRDLKVLGEGEAADTLFWVGCQSAFHDRGKVSAVRLAEILTRCGIDLAILGKAESCCGDPFRRLGNEYQFQNFARRNIEMLSRRRFNRIVTYCPHCYNTLKNEYPQLGGSFEVVHYTELFADLLAKGRLSLAPANGARVAYHDPCYLARGNDLTAGHEVLAALPGVQPLPLDRSRQQTFCCGGGGGAMWMRESGGDKINELRVRQLTADNPEVIATSCPYCVVMLEDGLKSLGLENVVCQDLIDLVRETVSPQEGGRC